MTRPTCVRDRGGWRGRPRRGQPGHPRWGRHLTGLSRPLYSPSIRPGICAIGWSASTSVLVVDDHDIVRSGVRRLLESTDEFAVVAEAGTVAEARELFARHAPGVVILDVVLAGGDGVQLCREILSGRDDVACLLLTSFPETRAVLSAALAGAAGYLPKQASSEDIIAAVRTAARGDTLLDQAHVHELLEELHARDEDDARLDQLTPQERRVFELVGQGLTNRDIAGRLHLAEKTVKNYVSRMLTKLGMGNRTQAAVLAARLTERNAQRRARRVGEEPSSPEDVV